MKKLKIGVVSLGCDKNRIDTEMVLGDLKTDYDIVNDPKLADIILVNTCGFIESAKQESIDTILEMSKYKKLYNCKMLIATGCLTQRYGNELFKLIPEIDAILGVNSYSDLQKIIDDFLKNGKRQVACSYSDKNINEGKRVLTTGTYSTYVRIAEGCNNFCTYCIIPKIRGKFRSRTIESIKNECMDLASKGVKEVILIAQDTAQYGIDIYHKKMLPELIREISKIESIEWIRLLYCYPEEMSDELIDEMAVNDKVCKYIDMPVQHISNNVLKNMKRRTRKEEILERINKLKSTVKDVTLRTSLIVGFPGETSSEFNELVDFVKSVKFEKLGVFKYSREEGTEAFDMPNQIDEKIKEQRLTDLMMVQQEISKKINKNKIGRIYKVLIEGKNEDYWFGRNFEMAPEIDGEIFFKCDKILTIGNYANVKIVDSLEYDLIGVVCDESCE